MVAGGAESAVTTPRAPWFGPRAATWILGSLGALLALAAWTLLSHWLATGGGVINRLPPPAKVARELASYAAGDLGRDLAFSLRVFVIGWLIGAALATACGLLLGRVAWAGRIFLPVVEAIRPVSSIAWVPLSVVWFGFGLTSKVFLVALAVFLVVKQANRFKGPVAASTKPCPKCLSAIPVGATRCAACCVDL